MSVVHTVELAVGVAAWLGFAWLCAVAPRGPRADVIGGVAWVVLRGYVWVMHRPRVIGAEHVPEWRAGDAPVGPLVLVSNHTAGIDPLLVHYACTLNVRWMMMRSMMWEPLNPLWDWLNVIPVEKNGRDAAAVRTALRELQERGVLGIFAEGGLERPPGVVMPYQAGVGLLVLKAKSRVLPVVISGTPYTKNAFSSMLVPSRPTVRFLPVRSYEGSKLGAAEIAEGLEREAADALGWPRRGDAVSA